MQEVLNPKTGWTGVRHTRERLGFDPWPEVYARWAAIYRRFTGRETVVNTQELKLILANWQGGEGDHEALMVAAMLLRIGQPAPLKGATALAWVS